MKPYRTGSEVDLVVISPNWYLSDFTPMLFMKKMPNSHGWVSPRSIEQDWKDQFDWVYAEQDYGVISMNCHPDTSGRPHILAMMERWIQYVNSHVGTKWMTFNDAAADFRRRFPFKSNSRPQV
jgi:hypothetical protein